MKETFDRTKPKVAVGMTDKIVESVVTVALSISHTKTPNPFRKIPKDKGFWINRSKRSIY